jgi:hypothetical protein
MAPKRHQAPSRIKYAAANPGHTVRFKPEAQAKIVAFCERYGVNYNQAVNIAVAGLSDAAMETIHSHAYELGFQEGVKGARPPARAVGFAEAANIYRLALPCHACGKPIELRTDSEDAQDLLKFCVMMEMDHTACPDDD